MVDPTPHGYSLKIFPTFSHSTPSFYEENTITVLLFNGDTSIAR